MFMLLITLGVILGCYVLLHSFLNYFSNLLIRKVEKNIWNSRLERISDILVFLNRYFPLIFITVCVIFILWKILQYK